MFTPEFVNEEIGEFVLIANHSLASTESVQLSIDYHLARINYGLSQLPPEIRRCRILYDIRGQSVRDAAIDSIHQAFRGVASVEFRR